MMKRICLFLIFALLAPNSFSQDSQKGSVKVVTDPIGVEVQLEGEVKLNGISPTTFKYFPSGAYNVKLSKPGYENRSSRVYLNADLPMDLQFRMSPKTKFKAAVRSLFIPGWGQRYGDSNKKGNLFTLLAAGTITAYFITDSDFDDKFENFENLLNEYDDLALTGNLAQLQELQPQLDQTQVDAYDAENIRRIAIGSAIAVWSLSVLDVLLFGPQRPLELNLGGVELSPEVEQDQFGLKLSRQF